MSKGVLVSMNDVASHYEGCLGLIALKSCQELSQKVDQAIRRQRTENYSYLIDIEEVRFSNGEGKIRLAESVRGKDVYILCDVGNYSITYEMFGFTNHMGPDEHFQDIKRAISAIRGKAKKVTVIMPLLYSSRQHRRRGRESSDCAMALQELERLGVHEIITFDAHDPNVQNAINLTSFENLYPTYDIVKTFIQHEIGLSIKKDSLIVISPDTGAMDRAVYYSSVLGVDIGLFYKRRDYSTIVNGKNPVVSHEYLGRNVEGCDVLIVDDMIASGQSVIDIARWLKTKNVKNVYIASTFAFFTEGIDLFERHYADGTIKRVYSTNLTYIPPAVKASEWFVEVDMSEFLAQIIEVLNSNASIAPFIDATRSIRGLLPRD